MTPRTTFRQSTCPRQTVPGRSADQRVTPIPRLSGLAPEAFRRNILYVAVPADWAGACRQDELYVRDLPGGGEAGVVVVRRHGVGVATLVDLRLSGRLQSGVRLARAEFEAG